MAVGLNVEGREVPRIINTMLDGSPEGARLRGP
jgi:hypothetical protein